jgi:hypothetical protein
VTDFALDQWRAGEHTEEREAALAAHLRGCARCRARNELLECERAAFLARAPTLEDNARLARRHERADRARRTPALRVALTLAAAAAAVLAVVASRPGTDHAAGERRKGGVGVGFYVKRGAHIMRGSTEDPVHPGDLLRFTYTSDAPAYWALLGRDAHAASVYFPSTIGAARLPAGHDRPLDFSLELDGQLGVERLFVVRCPQAFALEPLRRALASDGDLRAPAPCHVERIALRKEPPP